MTEQTPDRRGTVWDWPVGLMVASVALLAIWPRAVLLWALMFAFAGVAFMARRGVFSPRR